MLTSHNHKQSSRTAVCRSSQAAGRDKHRSTKQAAKQTTRQAFKQATKQATKQEVAAGGSRAGRRLGGTKQPAAGSRPPGGTTGQAGSAERAAGARSAERTECEAPSGWRLERRQERPAAERAAVRDAPLRVRQCGTPGRTLVSILLVGRSKVLPRQYWAILGPPPLIARLGGTWLSFGGAPPLAVCTPPL
jgi:hypothetical protein